MLGVMKKPLQLLSGLNLASVVRGLRFGLRDFAGACRASHAAAHPRESRASVKINHSLSLIPSVTLDDLLGKTQCLQHFELAPYEDGRLPVHEALALLALLTAEAPAEALEIGTYMGHTTKAMAQNLPGAIVHTVDLPPDFAEPKDPDPSLPKDDFHLIQRRIVGREFKGQPVENRIRQHFGDTAKINFQEFGKPTFFFIDGSHTYEYCRQDSEKCFALCGGRGVFLWHDCDDGHPGVIRFILEWRAAGRDIRRITGTSLAYWKP